MEDVLEVYARAPNHQVPLVCLDEFCKQLLKPARESLPPRSGSPECYDYEYVRHGCVSAFMIYAPLEGVREVYLGPEGRRTVHDYALALEKIATQMFPEAEKILLVEDNLNTHRDASLYATFEPVKARALAERFERHSTPKHGSWLNMAEIEIAAFTKSCLPDRVGDFEQFRTCIEQGVARRNALKVITNWQFTNSQARIKLRSLYPSPQS